MKTPKKTFTLPDLQRLREQAITASGPFDGSPLAHRAGVARLLSDWIEDLEDERARERKRLRDIREQTREAALKIARMDHPLPWVKGSDTSKAAAEKMERLAKSWRVKIYTYLRACPGGKTADELERELGIHPNTLTPRIRKLDELGLVVRTERTRETSHGAQAQVIVAAEHADDQPSLAI